jgi:hypothetical protein
MQNAAAVVFFQSCDSKAVGDQPWKGTCHRRDVDISTACILDSACFGPSQIVR